ncbi:growth hormone-inducible transmembrane protein-like isoform X2 [Mizuhopecten yessoensis]|uniref:Growth hormone-inducible transmembrane protein n=1 Tax=Mizuhopecten yessoensis TaxID=6573 RepID=A0A210PX27_MIZYE|nr:growth hormone-inducible transmembrane protein-like isoform X1 [Mizuhopecten yessoensis]XP_021373048.1 growth hormone-inducible transmembrane protein-like isoform X2 [Mizuhopecten yessoensis]OWF41019.1 Growth hormone-inducible transmembrane protein [Mizuhopecten yessoensis]
MWSTQLCRIPITAFLGSISKQHTLRAAQKSCTFVRVQQCSQNTRTAFSRRVQKRTSLKEKAMAPAGGKAFQIGNAVAAGSSAVGIGALCFYGLGLSNEAGAVDRALLWSQEVRQRIRATYMYFGGSVALTAMSAMAVVRTPALMNLAMKNSWLAIGASFAAMIGTGMLCRSIPYKEGLGAKQLAWMLHSGVIGMVIAPISLMGGPLLMRAAWYTAGVVGGLSTLAMCAPSEKFLNMGAPLTIGLGMVIVSSLGTMFFPPATALGAGLYSISVYGGVVLFGMFLLYDTQKIIKNAEHHPSYSPVPYDPVNQSIGIYLDTINIFIRLAMILGNNRKK